MTSETWDAVQDRIEKTVGSNNYAAWIKPLRFDRVEDQTLALASPTDFIGRWVQQHYSDAILRHTHEAGLDAIRLVCSAALPAAKAAPAPTQGVQARTRSEDGLDPRFTFDAFVVGKSNELAHAAARRVASGGPVTFNPLFLHGGVGLGKTHLM